ncbi:hypothetical protein HGRIS_008425 [Hohenbuehelia grisea]|uniref:RNA polymerase II subunit A C-terminal domain phosphatase n=1 Tax=Hohenbuehelia grisea TaxID=104357 RepID=A0ABR3J7W9_9AGAR
MSNPTALYLPHSFPFPIKITSLDSAANQSIARGARLLSYSFVHLAAQPGSQPETRFGTWDSTIEGTVESWNFKPGDVISARKAKDKPVVFILEPCTHGIQVGGLCGLCGKDMTDYDYTGFSDASRASIQMTHSAYGPTVSLEEARKIEKNTADHLLKSRKLSLIVDLDQTIVHATVDPTVGEWITEGEAWEARQASKALTSKDDSDDDSDDSSDSEEGDDECNPNWEALKDVKKFKLGPESFSPPSRSPKGKNKMIESDGCLYYIKPRPGWKQFLEDTATTYEMHVYTMGTRAYAEEVCAAIDPTGKIFGGRLLSRDESGSLTQKSLQRLFPCDTSMVVIIDDRADVWEWSPNLIKVIPYDFFVGIGDINSTFLPKVEPLTVTGPPVITTGASFLTFQVGSSPNQDLPSGPTNSSLAKTSDQPGSILEGDATQPSPEETEKAELQTDALLTQNSLALEAQLEERPLAKKQEELVASEEDTQTPIVPSSSSSEPAKPAEVVPKPERHARKALLKNDDDELERVSKLLKEVHTRFFDAYDMSIETQKEGRETFKRAYDVTRIIPRLRSDVLKGVHILFSSVIPLDTKPETTEIWKMAIMFGAKCSTELTGEVTHVVAAKHGTVKVDMARRRGGTKIVWVSWFTDSVAQWRHQDETPYLLDEPPVTGPSSSPAVDAVDISSDPDPDGDDWDRRPGEKALSLELDAIDWNDVNDEVDAAMNESDDDDDDARSDRSGVRGGNLSDEDWDVGSGASSVNGTPRMKRKRLRSITPSEGLPEIGETDLLRSPLAKRKKYTADRTGYSKLKEAFSADEVHDANGSKPPAVDNNTASVPPLIADIDEEDESEEESGDDEEGGGLDLDVDFLAGELEEEWG